TCRRPSGDGSRRRSPARCSPAAPTRWSPRPNCGRREPAPRARPRRTAPPATSSGSPTRARRCSGTTTRSTRAPRRRRWPPAGAALAAVDPAAALPLLIEAAEEVERVPPAVILPDTPHALAALVAVTAGDAATAEHLLRRALGAGVGGPVAAERHRLLLAWVH